ncbi:hypothetical protein ACIGFL_09440 [Pseudomonas sp. NPDC077649]|uniref:hypothetical protein n=1 Tax=Pseudomonas sp. NPDC077649 TaxID=3364423 RepID=UPI0037CC6E3B
MNRKVSSSETRMIEARISRSLRIAFWAALVIAFVIPMAENAFITSNTGRLVMRLTDISALLAIFLSLAKAFLLERRLNACRLLQLEQLKSEAEGQQKEKTKNRQCPEQ